MATLVKRGTFLSTSGTTWTNTANVNDGTPPANPATYAVWTSTTSGAQAEMRISSFDFSAIPAGSTINSVTCLLRHFESNTSRIATVTLQPYVSGSPLGSAFTCTKATAARDDSSTFPVTLAQLQDVNFHVRAIATRAAVTQSATFNVDHIDVTVDYTAPLPSLTQAAYRWYADGTESGSTALAAQDTAATLDLTSGDAFAHLRVRLQNTAANPGGSTDDYQLQFAVNGGTWLNVVLQGPE